MQPHVERMVKESKELFDKIEKLRTFIFKNPVFKTLPIEEQNDMHAQCQSMITYHDALVRRLNRQLPPTTEILQDKISDVIVDYMDFYCCTLGDEEKEVDLDFNIEDDDKIYMVQLQVEVAYKDCGHTSGCK